MDRYKVSYVKKGTFKRVYIKDSKGSIKYYTKEQAITLRNRLLGRGLLPHIVRERGVKKY